MNATTETVVRTGRVMLKVGHSPDRYESVLVQEHSDGQVLYYLGTPARTKDGWVTLPAEKVADVVWG